MLPHEILICSVVSAVLLLSHHNMADDVIIQKRVYDSDLAAMFDPKRKKPFCNAFTGCGRKRSDESMAALVELNSEPAVEELSRQIMSEAKNWETIQEARLEILRSLPKEVDPHKIAQRPFSMTGLKKRSISYAES